MRLLICGGRHFDDVMLVERQLSELHARTPISVLIHGGLPRMGMAAEAWARRNTVHVVRYPANFALGKAGDMTRDGFMLTDSRADMVFAFPGGERTRRLLRAALASQIEIRSVAGEEGPAAPMAMAA